MNASDVKLLAMVGAFPGHRETFHTALASMVVLIKGSAPRMFHNLASLFQLHFLIPTVDLRANPC